MDNIPNGTKYFSREDGSQNYFVFQPLIKYFILLTNNTVRARKSKGLSDESIKSSRYIR